MSSTSFDNLVESSIAETLSKILGEIVWKSIGFYFNPKALSGDPEVLPEVLGKLFGNHGKVLERVIAEDLLTKVGVPEESRKSSDFRSLIRVAKARFISSASVLTRSGASSI